ncbi:Multidrug resistance-associated protein 4 [Chionoecetes opilio]|uniref:Multidrug resistance-associated protein 4 n=1 Tax=Chionoecetes opilio TaxID=41210 RepID=A0A8J5CMX2_CHIOP|nr:Multidrug resistance-associated protein 4 [Chionoecetes opilio]
MSVMGKAFSRLRHATAMCTDRRIRSTHAVISAMRAIKMFTWEKLFMGILEAARKSEMAVIRRKALLMSFNSSLFGTLTKMVVFLILLTYVMLGNPLMADKRLLSPGLPGPVFQVFLTIALISSVQNSVTVYFPMSIINAAEVYMTCARLQKILEMEEKDEVGRIQHMETQLSPKVRL